MSTDIHKNSVQPGCVHVNTHSGVIAVIGAELASLIHERIVGIEIAQSHLLRHRIYPLIGAVYLVVADSVGYILVDDGEDGLADDLGVGTGLLESLKHVRIIPSELLLVQQGDTIDAQSDDKVFRLPPSSTVG